MNKLQLYITKSVEGYKMLFTINPSDEVSTHVRELNNVIDKVKYDPTEKNIFYYVHYIKQGTFITIIRTIPDRPHDHLAAWIFVPNELVMEGETLERVVGVTTRKVSGDKVTTEDVANLRELFATEYMTDGEAAAMTPSDVKLPLAWRHYDNEKGVSLTTLLGAGLFQLPYLDYNGVVFVDKELGLQIDGQDISELNIEPSAVIMPVEKTPENFQAHIFGHALNKPYRGSLNSNLAIVWRHAGFEDVVSEQVINSREFVAAPADTSSSSKTISSSSFQIAAQSGKVDLENCSILVNGVDVTSEPHNFTWAQLAQASVLIKCEGYAPYSARMDLASSTRALIRLQPRTKVYCFEMPVKSADLGAPIRFKIYSKKPITESPLEGYELHDSNVQEGESRTNHLAYVHSPLAGKEKIVFGCVGLVLGLIIGWLTGCGSTPKVPAHEENPAVTVTETTVVENGKEIQQVTISANGTKPAENETKSETKAVAETKPAETKVNNAAVTSDAIKYLDDNKVWTKQDMEKYECLRGLFDDLNNFRLEKLSKEWGSKLSSSAKFSKLATHAANGLAPKKKAKSKIEGDTFLKGDDTKITVVNYLYRIDP